MKKLMQKLTGIDSRSKVLFNSSRNLIGFTPLDGFVDCTSTKYKNRFEENHVLWTKYQDSVTLARAGGGLKAIERHTKLNRKLLVRDRLKLLLDDEKSFLELGSLAGMEMDYGDIAAAGQVTGIGRVSGQVCMIMANDATVKGGTMFPISVKKFLRCQEIAHQLRLPCIHLVDSGGAFLPLQSEIFLQGGRVFHNHALMGADKIPQISVVCGNCTAGGAYTPTMSDDTAIVHRTGSLFLGGPPLVKAATGEDVTAEDLGGATVHCRESGCADYFAPDEDSALKLCRDTVSTIRAEQRDKLNDAQELQPIFSVAELQGVAGVDSPSPSIVHQILGRILDQSEFSEFRQIYGEGIVCGYGRIATKVVGIVASVGGGIDSKSASKACQFVQMCDERDIPLLFFQRSLHEGWSLSEDYDLIKNTAQLISTLSTCSVPKIAVNIGNCFGSDYFALCGRSFSPAFYLSWPNAHIAFSKELLANEQSSAFYAASRLWIDELIKPKDTRKVLIKCLEALPTLTKKPVSARKGVIRM